MKPWWHGFFKKWISRRRWTSKQRQRLPPIKVIIHKNIVVNQPFTKEGFVYPVPAGLQHKRNN
jgi:hypothetical protein